jgi:hypothetical protein
MSRRVIDERDALRRTVARQDERIRELERIAEKLKKVEADNRDLRREVSAWRGA